MASGGPGGQTAKRLWELDAVRGLMLVLMTFTHLPTRLSDPTGQPFGFVSAAEGFVMLSAFMAGMVYTARERREGADAMRGAFFKRALKIYACQIALLLFLLTVVAVMGILTGQDAIINLIGFYLDRPLAAFFSGLLLIYSPPLLDILPIYIVFMLASPLLLLHGLHRGWGGILGLSLLMWLAAQFDIGRVIYEGVTAIAPIPVPYQQTGSFEIWGWQFLWVLGLWLGCMQAEQPDAPPTVFPRWMVNAAIGIAVVGFVWRHAIGQTPFPGQPSLAPLFDKWTLGPLRLMNFMALLLLAMHFAPWLRRHLPRLPVLETLGRASLPVFCAHLVLALVALALAGDVQPERPYWVDAAIVLVSFPALYLVAWVSGELDRRTAEKRAALKKRLSRKPRLAAAGADAGSGAGPMASVSATPPTSTPASSATPPAAAEPAAPGPSLAPTLAPARPRPAADAG
ncbi:OpgC domain-containing protein [Aquincola tertiaricarbonis]|uniref:OpgC domain-containing protein n=1 Tax=Aquincola tertiaricarbonis TaxID=391953 RepID=UPI000AC7C36F